MKVSVIVDRQKDGADTFYAVAHTTDLYAMVQAFDAELRNMAKYGSEGVDQVVAQAIRDRLFGIAQEYNINLYVEG